ncbi:hypothetical protein JSQ81_05905 [Sporosarcina sp. Marseille-Q4063]|uniref:hypothetical protein n=1 Tax=Sporosarcina sp. Marseille-Q4063 TaxID=2810514 RepID=UPI001BAFE752|nr:hypothetical protein [Sporosarcina sp. Marseille-Q4063]QUW23100.1 hypothetical protein JSQ81_05905 [Sporosarcina sp. Marseille-Q4063]
MNLKFSLFTLMLILLLSMMGCSGNNVTNEKPGNDRPFVESGEILEDSSGEIILEPPTLTIYVGEETVWPTLGTYSWRFENEDGTETAVESDSLAPSELVKNNKPLQVTVDTKVELNFEIQPDGYSVRIWDDDNHVISASDKVVLSGKGKIIYEVLAHWKQGTAVYVFSLNVE